MRSVDTHHAKDVIRIMKTTQFHRSPPKTWTLVVHPRREGLRIAEKGVRRVKGANKGLQRKKKPTRKWRRMQQLHNKGDFCVSSSVSLAPLLQLFSVKAQRRHIHFSSISPSISIHRCKLRNPHGLFCKGGSGWGGSHRGNTAKTISWQLLLTYCTAQCCWHVFGRWPHWWVGL